MRTRLVRPKRFAPSLRHYMWWRRRSVTCAIVTLRALDILRSADVILAEDTRVTATLLGRYGIATRPRALHRHNEAREVERMRADLAAGRSVALVSDAGTPAISDPGARLVRAVARPAIASCRSPARARVAAAFPRRASTRNRFVFIGFLPPQAKARRALLATFAPLPAALVFYEAPHRVADTLARAWRRRWTDAGC